MFGQGTTKSLKDSGEVSSEPEKTKRTKRRLEEDTIPSDNPYSPKRSSKLIWSHYESRPANQPKKGPIKRQRREASHTSAPAEQPLLPRSSRVPAASKRLKPYNVVGRKEHVDQTSDRAQRAEQKRLRQEQFEREQELIELRRQEAEDLAELLQEQVSILDKSLVPRSGLGDSSSAVPEDENTDKFLQTYLSAPTPAGSPLETPVEPLSEAESDIEDGTRSDPTDIVFGPTNPDPISDTSNTEPTSLVADTHPRVATEPTARSASPASEAGLYDDYIAAHDQSSRFIWEIEPSPPVPPSPPPDVHFTTLPPEPSEQRGIFSYSAQPQTEASLSQLVERRLRGDSTGGPEQTTVSGSETPEKVEFQTPPSKTGSSPARGPDSPDLNTRGAGPPTGLAPADGSPSVSFAIRRQLSPQLAEASSDRPVSITEARSAAVELASLNTGLDFKLLDRGSGLASEEWLLPSLRIREQPGRVSSTVRTPQLPEPSNVSAVSDSRDPSPEFPVFGKTFRFVDLEAQPEGQVSSSTTDPPVGPTQDTMASTETNKVKDESKPAVAPPPSGPSGTAETKTIEIKLPPTDAAEVTLDDCVAQFVQFAGVLAEYCVTTFDLATKEVSEQAQDIIARVLNLGNHSVQDQTEYWNEQKVAHKWPAQGKTPQDHKAYEEWITQMITLTTQRLADHLRGTLDANKEGYNEQLNNLDLTAHRKIYRQVVLELRQIRDALKQKQTHQITLAKLAASELLSAKEARARQDLKDQLEGLALNKTSKDPTTYYVPTPQDQHETYIHGRGVAPAVVAGFMPNTELPWIVPMATTHPHMYNYQVKPGYRFSEHESKKILDLAYHDPRCKVPIPGYPDSVQVFFDFNLVAVRVKVPEVEGRSALGWYRHISEEHHSHLRTYYYGTQGLTTSTHYLLVIMVNTMMSGDDGCTKLVKMREMCSRHRSTFMELITITNDMQRLAKEIFTDPRNNPRLSQKDLDRLATSIHRVNDKIGEANLFAKTIAYSAMESSKNIVLAFAVHHLMEFESKVSSVMEQMNQRGVPASEIEKLYVTTYRGQPLSGLSVPNLKHYTQASSQVFSTDSQPQPGQEVPLVVDSRALGPGAGWGSVPPQFHADLKLLPRQDLPLFNNKKQDYRRWKQKWMNFIGKDFRLPPSKKMWFLKEAIKKHCPHLHRIADYQLEEDEEGYQQLWAKLDSKYDRKGRELVMLWKKELQQLIPLTCKSDSYSEQVKAAEWFEAQLNRILKEYQDARNTDGYDPTLIWADIEPKIRHPYKLPWETYLAIKRGSDPEFLEKDLVREFRHWLASVLLPDLRKKQDLEAINKASRGDANQRNGQGGGGAGGAGAGGKGGGRQGNGRQNGQGKPGGGNSGRNGGGNNVTYISAAANNNTKNPSQSPANGGGGGLTLPSQVNLTKGQTKRQNKPNRVNPGPCILCKGSHNVSSCNASLNPEGLWDRFYSTDTCCACGLVGHYSSQCPWGKKCPVDNCGKPHLPILHNVPFSPYTIWRKANPERAARIEENRKKAAAAAQSGKGKPKGNKGQPSKGQPSKGEGTSSATKKPKGKGQSTKGQGKPKK